MKANVTNLMIAMARKNVNFGKLADVSGVSRQTLSYIKNGKSCKTDVAGKIAHALGVDVTEIFDVTE